MTVGGTSWSKGVLTLWLCKNCDDFTIANCNGTLGTWLVVSLQLQERVQTKVSPSIKSYIYPKMEDFFKSFSRKEWKCQLFTEAS